MPFYLGPLYRLGTGRHPGVFGALTAVAALLGLGGASSSLTLSVFRLLAVALLGAAAGMVIKKKLGSGRPYQSAVYVAPLLWLLPVGVIWGGVFSPLKIIWALVVLVFFVGMAFRLARKRALSIQDFFIAGKKGAYVLGMGLLFLAAVVLVTL